MVKTYTNSPWKVGSVSDSEYFAINIAGCDGYHVAKVSSRTNSEVLANAKLIAAAPELYEALSAIINALDFDDLIHDDQRTAFNNSLKALDKANGKQHDDGVLLAQDSVLR